MTSERRRRLLAAAALGLVVALVAVALAAWPHPSTLSCNGSRRLCDRGYDRVTYLTSHNAMASTARGFLAPDQDSDLIGQLDGGVRALMLDLHRWTTPADAAPVLTALGPEIRAVVAPLVRATPSRPGIWLCHEICQVGADPAVGQLALVRRWLSAHPDDVVTLILEDDISLADIRATVSAAGLDPWLATPPALGSSWPTLRQMILRHHTLAVFTQNARAAAGPIRNFYQYAAETPFHAATSAALTCVPGRGPATAPLFLVNNWVTMDIPTPASALAVDNATTLRDRLRRCAAQRKMRPTFVAVDFVETGSPLRVVDELNAR